MITWLKPGANGIKSTSTRINATNRCAVETSQKHFALRQTHDKLPAFPE
jgi:hypothetical protein